MSQQELADHMFVNRTLIARLEGKYKYRPTRDTILRLAQGMHLNNYQRNVLLCAAGYIPPELDGRWDASLQSCFLNHFQ